MRLDRALTGPFVVISYTLFTITKCACVSIESLCFVLLPVFFLCCVYTTACGEKIASSGHSKLCRDTAKDAVCVEMWNGEVFFVNVSGGTLKAVLGVLRTAGR